MNLRLPSPTTGESRHAPRLLVKLTERSASERLNPAAPHAWLLEAGIPGPTAPARSGRAGLVLEKGRMVSVLFDDLRLLPEAMHSLADLWDRQHRMDRALRISGELPIQFRVGYGATGIVIGSTAKLADAIHRVANTFARRRAEGLAADAASKRLVGPRKLLAEAMDAPAAPGLH